MIFFDIKNFAFLTLSIRIHFATVYINGVVKKGNKKKSCLVLCKIQTKYQNKCGCFPHIKNVNMNMLI